MIDPRRGLPSVTSLLDASLVDRYGHDRVAAAARSALEEARAAEPVPSTKQIVAQIEDRLIQTVRPVINATGVLLHTNLGRAPWSSAAIEAAAQVAKGYCTVEYDLKTGQRGGREAGVIDRICALTEFEAALVVNNCAAAVMLALRGVAEDQNVLVGRSELVEIGGSFRVPEIMALSGARLIEVGTTNRTHLRDYAARIDEAAAILRVHHSNFRQIGFVCQPTMAELAGLGRRLVVDLGSGQLDAGVEPSVAEARAAGADLVCMSGDKLLGGPQAGIIVGRKESVSRLRQHPLYRALRTDKVTQAALEATLDGWLRDRPVPIEAMRRASLASLRTVVECWRVALPDWVEAELFETKGRIGGGSLPGRTWPSVALAIRTPNPEVLRRHLLEGEIPIIGRIRRGALLLDARTVAPLGQSAALLTGLNAAIARSS